MSAIAKPGTTIAVSNKRTLTHAVIIVATLLDMSPNIMVLEDD
jgi:hypothetical protein